MGDCTPRGGGSAGEAQASSVEQLVYGLEEVVGAVFDAALIQNPWAFAGTAPPAPQRISLGANGLGEAVISHRNDLQVPVMVLVRLQPDGLGTKAYIQGAINDQDRAKNYAAGADTVFGEVAKFAMIVGPGEQLWVAGQNYVAVAADSAILVHAIPFRGRQTLARRS